jgi:hypothetical protein
MSFVALLFFPLIEPQNKRAPDLPEEECVKGEIKENGEADNKLFEEAAPEFGEAVVSELSLLIPSPCLVLICLLTWAFHPPEARNIQDGRGEK